MRFAVLFPVALSLAVMANRVEAHAFLVKSDPAVGSAATKPATLRLEFSEAIELGFSGMELLNASGVPVALNAIRFADEGHKVLVANLPMLAPGIYRVKWHVVSVDTHRTEGEFRFTAKQ